MAVLGHFTERLHLKENHLVAFTLSYPSLDAFKWNVCFGQIYYQFRKPPFQLINSQVLVVDEIIIKDICLYALPSQRVTNSGGQPTVYVVMASVNSRARSMLLVLGGTFGFQELFWDVYGEPADEIALEDRFYDICLNWLVEDDVPGSLVIARTAVAEVR